MVLKTLQDRFGSEDDHASFYLGAIDNLPMIKFSDVSRLRKFYDDLNANVQIIENMGPEVATKLDDPRRMKLLASKLPHNLVVAGLCIKKTILFVQICVPLQNGYEKRWKIWRRSKFKSIPTWVKSEWQQSKYLSHICIWQHETKSLKLKIKKRNFLLRKETVGYPEMVTTGQASVQFLEK